MESVFAIPAHGLLERDGDRPVRHTKTVPENPVKLCIFGLNAERDAAQDKRHANPGICVSPPSASRTNTTNLAWALSQGGGKVPLDMTLPSAHHSPNTVNRNANEFVMGTVRLNSASEKATISKVSQNTA